MEGGQQRPSLRAGAAGCQARKDPKRTPGRQLRPVGQEPSPHGCALSSSPSSTSGEGPRSGKPRNSCPRQKPRRSPSGHTREKQKYLGTESQSDTAGREPSVNLEGGRALQGTEGGGDARPRLAHAAGSSLPWASGGPRSASTHAAVGKDPATGPGLAGINVSSN